MVILGSEIPLFRGSSLTEKGKKLEPVASNILNQSRIRNLSDQEND
jgi:hypothetical protein